MNYRINTRQPSDIDGEYVLTQEQLTDILSRVDKLSDSSRFEFHDNYTFMETDDEATSDVSDWTPDDLFPGLF
jgi:hypothetical protein